MAVNARDGKSIAISQSNYIPWKGYFDLINSVDEFVLYDDAQYTRRDWRNRNRIKTAGGLRWLTIPVEVKGRFTQRVRETRVDGHDWARTHPKTLQHSYAQSPHFARYVDEIESAYRAAAQLTLLSDVNRLFLDRLCALLGVRTPIRWSSEFVLADGRTERLLEICRQAGATVYVSGPAARAYLDESLFHGAGIAVRWVDYAGYPEYPQPHPPFAHGVSVLDLLFNVGAEARTHFRSVTGRLW